MSENAINKFPFFFFWCQELTLRYGNEKVYVLFIPKELKIN